jgi:hypothetical protein
MKTPEEEIAEGKSWFWWFAGLALLCLGIGGCTALINITQ